MATQRPTARPDTSGKIINVQLANRPAAFLKYFSD